MKCLYQTLHFLYMKYKILLNGSYRVFNFFPLSGAYAFLMWMCLIKSHYEKYSEIHCFSFLPNGSDIFYYKDISLPPLFIKVDCIAEIMPQYRQNIAGLTSISLI